MSYSQSEADLVRENTALRAEVERLEHEVKRLQLGVEVGTAGIDAARLVGEDFGKLAAHEQVSALTIRLNQAENERAALRAEVERLEVVEEHGMYALCAEHPLTYSPDKRQPCPCCLAEALRAKLAKAEEALETIECAYWTDGESGDERVTDLQEMACKALAAIRGEKP